MKLNRPGVVRPHAAEAVHGRHGLLVPPGVELSNGEVVEKSSPMLFGIIGVLFVVFVVVVVASVAMKPKKA